LSANEKQIGGSHYKTGGEEHWDRQYRLFGPGYFIGCITKYVERYRRKNGLEDLLKAQHFLEKLIEIEGAKPKDGSEPTLEYVNQDRADVLKGEPIPDYTKPLGRRF
jgi:hypothetical protein